VATVPCRTKQRLANQLQGHGNNFAGGQAPDRLTSSATRLLLGCAAYKHFLIRKAQSKQLKSPWDFRSLKPVVGQHGKNDPPLPKWRLDERPRFDSRTKSGSP